MNRTGLVLSTAGLLLVAAVVLGVPAGRVVPPVPTPAPTSTGSLSVTGAVSNPWLAPGTSDVFATLEVTAVDVPGARRAPVNLAVVIDRSGSMAGAKLQGARQAALRLVSLLDEQDRVSITHYGNDVVSFPGTFATPSARAAMAGFIEAIAPEGGTNTGEGLLEGRAQLAAAGGRFRVNRLLLLSDGQPTVGMTSPQDLAGLAASFRQSGVTVSALGLGADFNEDLMQRLADVGGGSYAFVQDREPQALTRLFEADLQQAGTVVARGASLAFTLPPGTSFVEVYGRPAAVTGDRVAITLPDFSARQRERLVLHLRASVSQREGAMALGQVELQYHDVLASRPASAALSLAAQVSTDRGLAARPAAPQVVVQVARARAAENYRQAALALDRGDTGEAQRTLGRNTELLRDAEQAAGPGAVDDEKAASQVMLGLSSAPAAARPEAVKQMKVQSLRSAGRGESVR
jgi:Ca-activated chloride channel family protein